MDDALYERDRKVEERLNVDINNIGMSYTWDTRDVYIGSIRNSVMAGDGTYDIVSGQYATMPSLITDGCLLDLNQQKYLDFEMPWWVSSIADETTIEGKLYLMTGDITKQTVGTISCLFANKRLLEDYNLQNPVELVDEGKWTLDALFSMTADIYTDVNNNDAADIEDIYGFGFFSQNAVYPFGQGSELRVTTLNDKGLPVLSYGTEKVIDLYDRLCAFMHDNSGTYFRKNSDDVNAVFDMFNEGRVVINAGAFGDAKSKYGNMADEFTVIPYPKYDEMQKEYHARLGEANTLLGITASAKDPDMVSAVMEALASESYRTVTPALYEVTLKVKYSMNDETGRMFDLIRSGISYDFGALYYSVTSISTTYRDAIYNNKDSWASQYASLEAQHQAKIDAFVESVKELDN